MHIMISGKQLDVGDALRAHVEETLRTIIGKYWDHALEAQITFSRLRTFFHCDVLIHAGRGITMKAEAEADQPYPAFHQAAEHIGKRLRRYRRRLSEHHRALANRERPEKTQVYVLRPEPEEEHGEEHAEPAPAAKPANAGHAGNPGNPRPAATGNGEGGDAPLIVAEMPGEIASLTVGEAVMRMDLAAQPILVFRNRAHGGINVVYRRSDGNIGWVDPRGTGGAPGAA